MARAATRVNLFKKKCCIEVFLLWRSTECVQSRKSCSKWRAAALSWKNKQARWPWQGRKLDVKKTVADNLITLDKNNNLESMNTAMTEYGMVECARNGKSVN